MKRLTGDHLFKNYPFRDSDGNFHPPRLPEGPMFRVQQGESFMIDTVDTGHMLLLDERISVNQLGQWPATLPPVLSMWKASGRVMLSL